MIGAGTRAARGESADEILKFYYPGLTVGTGSPAVLTTNAPTLLAPQREAYARAEACFAREIADGKRWDQIR